MYAVFLGKLICKNRQGLKPIMSLNLKFILHHSLPVLYNFSFLVFFYTDVPEHVISILKTF